MISENLRILLGVFAFVIVVHGDTDRTGLGIAAAAFLMLVAVLGRLPW